MADHNDSNSVGGQALVYAGIVLFASPLCVAAFTPQMPILVAIPLGIVLGVPAMILGMRLQAKSMPKGATSKSFWPSSKEKWGMIGLLTWFCALFAPLLIIVLLGLMLPAGDGWGIVALRLAFVGAFFAGYWWWLHFAAKTLPELFRGKLSDQVIDTFTHPPAPAQPSTLKEAAQRHAWLLIAAIVAFVVFWGLIDLNNPVLQWNAGPRRLRGITQILIWCRGNPNTARSSALMVGIGAIILYAYQLRQTWIRRALATPQPTASVDPDAEVAANPQPVQHG